MPFIPPGMGKPDQPPPPKKETGFQELSLAGEAEKALQEKLQAQMAQLRQKERDLEKAYREKMESVELEIEIKHQAETAQFKDQLDASRQETAKRTRELGREMQKTGLLMKQVQTHQKRAMDLERGLAHERRLAQDAAAARDAAEAKKSPTSGGESVQHANTLRQLVEARERIKLLETKLEAADKRAVSASDLDPKASVAPGAAAPAPVHTGQLQEKFNEMTKARPGLLGWSSKQLEDPTLIVKVVQFIFDNAARSQTSDIHLEPMERCMRVRFRIDGMLEEVLQVPDPKKLPVISRIRVMCGLDPEQGSSTAKPQEGRMVVSVDGREMDLRLSTFPTAYGDKAVLRLIQRKDKSFELDELGFSKEVTETMRRIIHRPQGMIIVTGPAGSGKSTTLYTCLQALNTPERNIVTLEDPIEMKIRGLNQCNVVPKIGFTFAEGLRAILRQDPNVVMVGEVRDPETAEIAMSAALTGHMLFTTLHTNSAAGAITRLMDMGLEPYLIASAVSAVFAQRLVRRLCPDCQKEDPPPPRVLEEMREAAQQFGLSTELQAVKFKTGTGCEACRGSGYRGRILLFEMVHDFPGMRKLILQKADLKDIEAAAIKAGLRTMLAHGLEKVISGETSLEEVHRVVGQREG